MRICLLHYLWISFRFLSYFFNVLKFLLYNSFIGLLRITFRYLFFEVIKVLFLLFLFQSICYLYIGRKPTDFCILILYYAIFLKVFISYRSFLVLGSFMYKIMPSSNTDALTSFLPICISLISFSCPIALA